MDLRRTDLRRLTHARTRKSFPVPGNVTRKRTIFYAYAARTEQKAFDAGKGVRTGWLK